MSKQDEKATIPAGPKFFEKFKRYATPEKFTWLLVILAAGLWSFRGLLFGNPDTLSPLELMEKARAGQVTEAVADDGDSQLMVKLKGSNTEWLVAYPEASFGKELEKLTELNVAVTPAKNDSLINSIATFVLLLMALSLVRRLAENAGKKLKEIAQKRATTESEQPKTRLSDVKGMPEVVAEARAIVAILRDPSAAEEIGARLPAGLVLHGEPGTGKTLLARAIAGEADVPFFDVKGSAIRSMWIGEAQKKIAELFRAARKHPVSIIFFDEGDTLGGRRTSREGGGGDAEHRAMVNELLTQMNPEQPGGHVFVIMATNHPDALDEALTRSGRIDLQLEVLPPDVEGRKAILEAHTAGKKLADDVSLAEFARETYGFTGADIEALINNALVKALQRPNEAKQVTAADFYAALIVMRAGPASSRTVSDEDRTITAYHEAGHALAAAVQDQTANPTTITIVAHGRSGGHTQTIPDGTQSQYTSCEAAFQELVKLMAGLVGEKLALNGSFTNGPTSDRERATQLATQMICSWGMGTYNLTFGQYWRTGPHADAAFHQIEELLDKAEEQALTLLLQHKSAFEALVQQLLEKETLRASDLAGYRPQPESVEAFDQLKHAHQKLFDGIKRVVPADAINGHHLHNTH